MALLETLGVLAPFIGQGASAGLQIGAGSKNRRNARYMQEQQNIANMEMAEYAYQKDLEQWNRANEYNLPENQMKRLKDAGLNPNLVYGTGAVANTQTGAPPRYQAPRIEKTSFDRDLSSLNALAPYLDLTLRQAQTNNLKADTDKKLADVSKTNMETAIADLKREFDHATFETRAKTLQAKKRQLYQQIAMNIEKHDQEYQKYLQNTSLNKQKMDMNDLQLQLMDLKRKDLASPYSREQRANLYAILAFMQGVGWIDAKWINDFLNKAGVPTLRERKKELEK